MKKSESQIEHEINVYLDGSGRGRRPARTSPCRPWPGAGYLVRTSYRVPPFLADDVLWVQHRDAGAKGRVFCVAYDMVWRERVRERSGWLDVETLTPIWERGMRVELSPTCDLWMRGQAYRRGTVRQVTMDWTVVVKMDAPDIRELQRFTDYTALKLVEE
jgi:hypothetical protein